MKAVEIPVEWAHDHRSKVRVFRDGFRMFVDLLIVRWYQIGNKYALDGSSGIQPSVAVVPTRKESETFFQSTCKGIFLPDRS